MKLLVVSLLIAITSCGRAHNIDPELATYVAKFHECLPETQRVDAVVFGEMPKDDVQGYCDMRLNPTLKGYVEQVIVIKRSVWEDLPEISRQALINHEMLHCVSFTVDLYKSSDKSDWMFCEGVNPEIYEEHWQENEAKYCKPHD
jgi:hypothetical protein